jgi:cobalamin biosynthesis protein CobT
VPESETGGADEVEEEEEVERFREFLDQVTPEDFDKS